MIQLTKDVAIAVSQIVAMQRQDGYASLPDRTGGYIYLAENSHGFWVQGNAFDKLWADLVDKEWVLSKPPPPPPVPPARELPPNERIRENSDKPREVT